MEHLKEQEKFNSNEEEENTDKIVVLLSNNHVKNYHAEDHSK